MSISGFARNNMKHMPWLKGIPSSISITLAASATTDGLEFTIKYLDAAGNVMTGVRAVHAWISESANGAGLTADAASGALTAVSGKGTIHTAVTAKKEITGVTNANGVFTGLIVDSANPTDQYFAARMPHTGQVFVSGASLTNWEGA